MHHRKYSNFLILSFIAVSIFGAYRYFTSDLKVTAATSSGITSSLDNTDTSKSKSTENTASNKKTLEDISFLKTLSSLNNLKIDTSLFEDRNFRLLIDNNIKLEKVPYGRPNPFLPVDRVVDNKSAFLLSTLPATIVTTNTAQLNGSIEGGTSNNIYFEYGPVETFGKATLKVTPSLVGGLTININQLNTKTKYFYRVVANINGVLTYGEPMSFITN